jgi:hypothetical protein
MGDVYVESGDELGLYSLTWARLVTEALDPGESTKMITEITEEN